MTITLLDLYNSAATQEWSMYDNDAKDTSDFESALVLAINKAILDIYASYDFSFRERTHLALTISRVNIYDLPSGIIKREKQDLYNVRYNSKRLKFTKNISDINLKKGEPCEFCIKNDKLILNPIPEEKGFLTIDYYTLAIGENSSGDEIYSLQKADDILVVPVYLEALVKEAIITRTMLYTIASETDENYSAYKNQADKALRLLIKYAKSLKINKSVKI